MNDSGQPVEKDGASRAGRCAIERCAGTPVDGDGFCLTHLELLTRPLPERLEKRCSSH